MGHEGGIKRGAEGWDSNIQWHFNGTVPATSII